MRRCFASLFVLLFALVTALPAFAASFSDTSGHWAEPTINEAADKGLIGGNPDGTFRPNDPLTRAAFVTLISKALKLPALVPDTPTFADTAGHWVVAQGHLEAAVRAGIVQTADYGTAFEPDRPIPREEIAMMAVRALGIDAWGQPPVGTDASAISAARRAQVAAAQDLGLVTGFPDGSLQPQETATRAQAAVIILRVAERLDRLAQPVLPVGFESHCAAASVSAEPTPAAKRFDEAAAALGINLSDTNPARPSLCEGSDNPALRLVQLLIDEAKAAGTAGDLPRATRLKTEGMNLLRGLVPTLAVSRGGLIALIGPKLAAVSAPPSGGLAAPQSVRDHLSAGRQASELGEQDLAARELEAAAREHADWAKEQLDRLSREGSPADQDVRDIIELWRESELLGNKDLAQRAQQLLTEMVQKRYEQAIETASCPPTEAELKEILRLGREASLLGLDQDGALSDAMREKAELFLRQEAQATGANLQQLARTARLLNLQKLADEMERGSVEAPLCDGVWVGTVTVVRTFDIDWTQEYEMGYESEKAQLEWKHVLEVRVDGTSHTSTVTGDVTRVLVNNSTGSLDCPGNSRETSNYTASGEERLSSDRPYGQLWIGPDGRYSFGTLLLVPEITVNGTFHNEYRDCDDDIVLTGETGSGGYLLPPDIWDNEEIGVDVRVEDQAGTPHPSRLEGSRTKQFQVTGGNMTEMVTWKFVRD